MQTRCAELVAAEFCPLAFFFTDNHSNQGKN